MPGTVNCSFIGKPDWHTSCLSNFSDQSNTIYILHGVTTGLLPLYDSCFALLNPQEQAKGLRYYQLQHQQRYVIQHGILRALLGKYMGPSPLEIGFTYNTTQKPYLAAPKQACYFNISHTQNEFLIAIGDVELGVDIEYINPSFAYREVASNYFSSAEVAYINASPHPTEAFFLLWTRKEALLKSCGTGIDDDLPAMPALDGRYALPAGYKDITWLTESFYAGKECMGSLTYPSPKMNLQFCELDIEALPPLLKG